MLQPIIESLKAFMAESGQNIVLAVQVLSIILTVFGIFFVIVAQPDQVVGDPKRRTFVDRGGRDRFIRFATAFFISLTSAIASLLLPQQIVLYVVVTGAIAVGLGLTMLILYKLGKALWFGFITARREKNLM